MRIKRLLSLALALVMIMSVGLSAGFSDKDQIAPSLSDEIDLVTALHDAQGRDPCGG